MTAEILVPEDYLGNTLSDFTGVRKGSISETLVFNGARIIRGIVPLNSMIGYSTEIRSRTQGQGSFSLEFSHYEDLTTFEYDALLKKFRGF